jgi:type IV secretory pathway VirB4 component
MAGSILSKIPSTQEHLEIEDIRDGFVILKNGMVSIVLEVNALNFDLLSAEEQDIKIMQFAALLNSLNFVFQIVIRTELTDTTDYIDKLRVYAQTQISDELKNQIEIYINFINNLTINKDVLDKTFYVVIPESPSVVEKTSFVKQIFGKKNKITNIKSILDYVKPRLTPKGENIIRQFKNIGLIAKRVDTDGLIRVYYSMYDPDKTGISKLKLSTTEFTSSLVQPKVTK